LVADAENGSDAIYLAEREPPIDSQIVTPFSLLMRKYLRGGTVIAVEQPPLERVVRLSIAKRLEPAHRGDAPDVPDVVDEEPDEDPEGIEGATFVHLVVEVMGRHSNLILVDDDGRVMESVKRVNPSMSRVRPVLPKMPYTSPPAQEKADPRRVTAESLRSWLEDGSPRQTLAKALPADFRAMSPQLAREVAFLVGGRVDATRADAVGRGPGGAREAGSGLYEPVLTGEWRPVVYRAEDEQAVAFSPYPLEHLQASATEVPVASISAAAEAVVSREDEESPGRHAGRIARLLAEIATVRSRLVAKIESLDVQTDRMVDADTRRLWGELIYGYLWKIDRAMWSSTRTA
jgi:predicted ribosome quality control (RQC) complex YloA/Tae2 family protein